jgi:hypothetical protein
MTFFFFFFNVTKIAQKRVQDVQKPQNKERISTKKNPRCNTVECLYELNSVDSLVQFCVMF